MSAVLEKGSAVWLLALTLLPFTAPFATCDLATLMGAPGQDPVSATTLSGSRTDAALSRVVTVRRAIGRVKLITLHTHATTPSVSNRTAARLARIGDMIGVTTSPALTLILRI